MDKLTGHMKKVYVVVVAAERGLLVSQSKVFTCIMWDS